MLPLKELSILAAHHAQSRVLSAYITVPTGDGVPMERGRILLRNGIAAAARSLGSVSHSEREEFNACAAQLLEQITDWQGSVPPFTWVGFAPAGDRATVFVVPDSLPPRAGQTVVWRDGIAVAPYFALRPAESCTVVLVDHERAALLQIGAEVKELARFETIAAIETGSHMSAPPQRSFHHGTQGTPATDSAARQARGAYVRHRSRVIDAIQRINPAERIILGGDTEATMNVAAELPHDIRKHVTITHELHFDSTVPQIRAVAMSLERQLLSMTERTVAIEVSGRAHSAARTAALGLDLVRSALDQGAAGTLLLSIDRIEHQFETAEALVRTALAQHAVVQVLHDAAAAFLELSAGGIAAMLRFPVTAIDTQVSAHMSR